MVLHQFRSFAIVACLTVAAVLAAACGGPSGEPGSSSGGEADASTTTDPADTSTTTTADPVPADLASRVCASGDTGEELGRVQNPTLVEVSGLVASEANPGVLWTHNDSGGEPAIYAVGTDGTDLGVWDVAGAEARDWEEMAGWYDADADEHYLYLADIGDNASQRESITVYRVPEPAVVAAAGTGGGTTSAAVAYELVYPDGPHDAETFFVDPTTGDWYLLTKGWGTGLSQVFRMSAPAAGATTTLEDVGVTVDFKELGSYATAGDANGVLVVRTYDEVAVWALDGSPVDALADEPCTGPSADEAQGEAIAIAPDRSGYYTVSEGSNAPILWFAFSS